MMVEVVPGSGPVVLMVFKSVSNQIVLHKDVQHTARMQGFFQTRRYNAPMTDQDSHLRRLREAAGLSVRELARRIGQQPTNVSFWERMGKTPRSDVLIPMAKALGVSVDELLGQREPRRSAPESRLGRTFEAVSQLPRRQQAKVLDVTEAMLAQIESHATTAEK